MCCLCLFWVVETCCNCFRMFCVDVGLCFGCFALLTMFEVVLRCFLAPFRESCERDFPFTGDKTCDALAPTVLVSVGASLAEVAVLTNSPQITVELQCRCRGEGQTGRGRHWMKCWSTPEHKDGIGRILLRGNLEDTWNLSHMRDTGCLHRNSSVSFTVAVTLNPVPQSDEHNGGGVGKGHKNLS